MTNRTNELLHIIQDKFNDVKIEAVESQSEWGTTHYQIAIYSESEVRGECERYSGSAFERNDKAAGIERLHDFVTDGVAAVLDFSCVGSGNTFDDAVLSFFDSHFFPAEK